MQSRGNDGTWGKAKKGFELRAEALAQARQTAISESAELILAAKEDTHLICANILKVDAEI